MTRVARSLADAFDPRANSVNAIRLCLAAMVILWHSAALLGRSSTGTFGTVLLSDLPVDGFFAISGFLLTGSLVHRPTLGAYLRNRFLRLMPAFWVALILVAVVFAPVTTALLHGDVGSVFSGRHSAWHYLLSNSYLWMHFYDVGHTPAGVPDAGTWDGSLWTLRWEAMAYLGLAALSFLRLLRNRWVVLTLWTLVWLLALALALHATPSAYLYYQVTFARLGLMFLSGVLVQRFSSVLPARGWLAASCAAAIVAGCWLPDYRLLAAAPLAYLLIWVGSTVKHRALQLHDRDISYGVYIYGMPVQQTFLLFGAAALPLPVFAALSLVATVPLAMASWVFIERPALRLRRRASPASPRPGELDAPGVKRRLWLGPARRPPAAAHSEGVVR